MRRCWSEWNDDSWNIEISFLISLLFCVSRKAKIFSEYFNIYGLFHLLFPLFIDSMLLFNLFERGFEPMSLIVYFAFFCILASSAALSQVLIGHVSLGAYFAFNAPFSNIDYCICLKADAFYNSVYQLNWHDLHVKEQKIILLMIRRSQDSVSIKAGSYYQLNMALLTKVKMVSNNYMRLQR